MHCNGHAELMHGRVWSISAPVVYFKMCFTTPRFPVLFHSSSLEAKQIDSISTVDHSSVLGYPGSIKTDGHVDLDWNVERFDEFGPSACGQESNPSDKKHISLLWISLSCLRTCNCVINSNYWGAIHHLEVHFLSAWLGTTSQLPLFVSVGF